MAGRPLSSERRAGIEAWADRNPHSPHTRVLRDLLADIDWLHGEIDRLNSPQPLADWDTDMECPLTTQQRRIFLAMANGASVEEIAEQLAIDRKTVRKYRQLGQQRLGVRTAAQAVAACLINGWFPTAALRLPSIPRRLSPVMVRNTYRERAELLRQTPGEWGTVAAYDSGPTARQSAYRLRSGRFRAFHPVGVWDAQAFTDDGTHYVRARYLGTPTYEERAAS